MAKATDPKSLPKSFEPFPIAMEILRKYGGRSLRKPSEMLVLDPTAGDEIADDIKKYEILSGVGYVLWAFGGMELLASSFEIALEHLAFGYRINRRIQKRDSSAHE